MTFCHYRGKDQIEVDVVLARGRKVRGVEVKAGSTITPADRRGRRRLAEAAGHHFERGVVLYGGTSTLATGDSRVLAVPLSEPGRTDRPSGGRHMFLHQSIAVLAVVLAAQAAAQRTDLAQALAGGKLRAVNREVTLLQGTPGAVHVSEKADVGIVWIEGSNFGLGTIEVDVRGRDLMQRSFLGIAFHGKDDTTYEAVYLRPFNFRATDPARHQHAVQYMMVPDFDWPKLREQSPEEFENPVDQAVSPADWVPVRVVVGPKTVQIFVGPSKTPALEARKLGSLYSGKIGLWTGNNSDGDFAHVRITPEK